MFNRWGNTVMIKKALFAALLAAAAAVPAAAVNFSFTGTFSDPNNVQFFDFTVGAASNVTLRSWSYAGGVNAAGATIARGGFDPILAVYALPGGAIIGQQDDGGCGLVAADAVTGRCWDTNFTVALGPGNYRASVMAYSNFAIGPNLSNGFSNTGSFTDATGNRRTTSWAFDILNVENATQGGVPEPASWAMLIAGFGLTGAAMRRRRATVAAA